MACMPSMADWGGLMIGVDSMLPYTPPLLMVKVPPAMSSMLIVPSRAFLPSALIAYTPTLIVHPGSAPVLMLPQVLNGCEKW